MPRRKGYRVNGLNRLQNTMKRWGEEAQREMQKLVRELGEQVLHDARTLVPAPGRSPYATGELLDDLRLAFSGTGNTAAVGADVVQGRMVELGIHGPRQPYLEPALNSAQPRFLAQIEPRVLRAARKVAGR